MEDNTAKGTEGEDKENPPANKLDIDSILLPKKEPPPGQSTASAQRVNAGILFDQEQQAALPPQEPQVPGAPSPMRSVPNTTERKEDAPVVTPLHTYKGDIQSVVSEKNLSVVSIAAAEAEANQRSGGAGSTAAPESSVGGRMAMIVAGISLVVLALGGISFALLSPSGKGPEQQLTLPGLMYVDETVVVTVEQNDRHAELMEKLQAAREGVVLPLGLVERLFVAQATSSEALEALNPQTFMTLLAPSAEDALTRTVDDYLLGVHSYDENQAFLVMRVDSYESAYAGMLAWERGMPDDLKPVFTRNPSPHAEPATQAPATAAATSTSTTSASSAPSVPKFLNTQFIDRIIENHDSRVILNEDGEILLVWTFVDRSTIAITTNDATLREIISSLSTPVIPVPGR